MSEVDSVKNVVYGTAKNHQGIATDLELDLYFPSNSIDTLHLRPFVLVINGGGFIAGDKSDRRIECITLAQKGYVAATINYRSDWITSIQQIQAIY